MSNERDNEGGGGGGPTSGEPAWLARAEVGGLIVLAVAMGAWMAPANIATHWIDPAMTGRVAPIANRMAQGMRLYADGGHTAWPPLAFVLVRVASLGHATWVLDSALTFALRVASLALVFVALSRRLPRPIPALATLAAGAVFFSLQQSVLYDALAQCFVAAMGLAAQIHHDRADRAFSARVERGPLVALGAASALALLSRQGVAVGASLGALAYLASSADDWRSRRTRIGLYAAAFVGVFTGTALLCAPWIDPLGMLRDVYVGGLLPPGGIKVVADKVVAFALEQGLILVVAVVPILYVYRALGRQIGEVDADGPSTRRWAPLPARRSGIYWLAAAAGVILALRVWPAFLVWGPRIARPGTRGESGFPFLSYEAWTCWDEHHAAMGYPAFAGFRLLQGCWLILLFVALRSLRRHPRERRWMLDGLATLAVVFLPASLGESLAGNWPRWVFAENPVLPLAFAVAMVAALRWRPARLSPRAGQAVSAVFTVLVVFSAWARLQPRLQRIQECNRSWTSAAILKGARMRDDAEILGALVMRVRALAPDAEHDRVLMLPEDPNVETWFERPRPALSSTVIAPGEYSPDRVQEDLRRLTEDPPKVIITGPEEAYSEAGGEIRPLPWNLREPGARSLMHELEAGLLAERYVHQERGVVPIELGTARFLGHVNVWVLRPDGGKTPGPPDVDLCAGRSRPLVVYWTEDHSRSATFATPEGASAAAEDKAWGTPSEASVCTVPVPGTVALKSFFHCWAKDYVTTATLDGDFVARSSGFTMRRVEGYVFANEIPGTVPLYLLYRPQTHDHLTTASQEEFQAALDAGYIFLRIEGYAPRYVNRG